jgi:hypothetical protein
VAFGLTAGGRQAQFDGSWPAVLLSLSSSIDKDKAFDATEAFARPDLATDWGSRWLSSRNPLYDPVSYNNGSAWPFISGLVALAQYRHDQPLAGFATWSAIAQLTGIEKPGALPEQMTGDRYLAQARAVPHQLFSSVGVVLPITRGILGLSAGASRGELAFRPALPAQWPWLSFSDFVFAGHRLRGELRQSASEMRLSLDDASEAPLAVDFSPALPWGARVSRVLVDGKPAGFHQADTAALSRVEIRFRLERHADVVIQYGGGIGVVPAVPHPEPGDRTEQLKLLRVSQPVSPAGAAPKELTLRVAGLAGRSYVVDLVTRLRAIAADGATVVKTAAGFRLNISFAKSPGGSGYVERDIHIRY